MWPRGTRRGRRLGFPLVKHQALGRQFPGRVAGEHGRGWAARAMPISSGRIEPTMPATRQRGTRGNRLSLERLALERLVLNVR
jgi:hypothetical protein